MNKVMMLAVVCLAGLVFQAGAEVELGAKTLTLENGTVMENLTVIAVDPDGVRYETEAGGGKVKFPKLSKAEQVKYGYDAAAAEKFTADRKAAQEAAAAYVAANPPKPAVITKKVAFSSPEDKKAAKARMKEIELQVGQLLNKYENRTKVTSGEDSMFRKTSDGWRPFNPMNGRVDKSYDAKALKVEYLELEGLLSLPDKP